MAQRLMEGEGDAEGPVNMKEIAAKLRGIADELERILPPDNTSFRETFQLFELPDIVVSVVDYLQPLLTPYEAAIYWYMFRQSIIANGDVFVRVSVRGLQDGVITSIYSGVKKGMSYETVQTCLSTLCDKGAISLAGDTTHEGTPYRVNLPEQIATCRDEMAKTQEERLPGIDPNRELDFYNIRENRQKVFERDKFLCHHRGKLLTRFSATLDHLQPVSEGGDNSYGNLVTSCLQCNSQRGAQTLMDFLTRKHGSHV